MSNPLQSLATSAAGLTAQAERINIIAQNIANADTPGYQRKQISFVEFMGQDHITRVKVDDVYLSQDQVKQIYDPKHPLSNESGFYGGSNVNLLIEMADSREAQRSYEANLRSYEVARQMSRSLLDLLRR
ncbi:MAG: flagellar basal body rod protein FlgC [Pseudomonadota bacterium]